MAVKTKDSRLKSISSDIVNALKNQMPDVLDIDRYNGELEDLMQMQSVVPNLPTVKVLIPAFDNQEDAGDGLRTYSNFRTYLIQVVVFSESIRDLAEAADESYWLIEQVENAIDGNDLGVNFAQAINLVNVALEDGSFLNNIIAYTMNFEWQFQRDTTNDN